MSGLTVSKKEVGCPKWVGLLVLVLTGVSGLGYWKHREVRDWIPEHPYLIAVVGAMVVPIGLFLKKVWKRVWDQDLEPRAVKATADMLKSAVETAVSGFRRRYLEEVCSRHRWFNVRGLRTQGMHKLKLDHVFVELRIAPQELNKASADPIRGEVLSGNRTVWEFLVSPEPAYRCLAVVGAPGCGKTTLLQHLALTLAQNRQRRYQRRCRALIPVFLFLRDHKETLWKKDQPELDQLLTDHFISERLKPPRGWFKHKLDSGRCLVLLDGLDEVADKLRRKKIVEWVDRQVERYPRCRFLVTSRPHGYMTNPLRTASAIEVQPFTWEQVQRFVKSWYLQNEILSTGLDDQGVRDEAGREADDLLRRLLTSPTLTRLAVNPLLLTMIAMVHRYRGALPGRRVELYAEICEVLLGHWQTARGIPDPLTAAQKRQVLQPLAFAMMERQVREFALADALTVIRDPLANVGGDAFDTEEDFLKQAEARSGLLLERESGIYAFAHLTFQEYLAASHLLQTKQEHFLCERIADPWWRETIRLYAAQSDATSILNACLEFADRSDVDDGQRIRVLTLAYDCQNEALSSAPEVKQRLRVIILEGLESANPDRQHLAANVLLAMRLEQLMRLDETREIDTSYVSCAEYQVFIDEGRARGKFRQPDHWDSYRFPLGSALEPITGVRYRDAEDFCEWLTEHSRAMGDVRLRFRLPTCDEARQNPLNPVIANSLFDRLRRTDMGCWCSNPPSIAGVAPGHLEEWQKKVVAEIELVTESVPLPSEQGRWYRDARARVRALAFALARDRDLALALALDRDLDRALDLDLDRVVALALDRDRDLARARARALDHVLASDLARALDRARALDLDRARDLARVRVLDRARTLDRDRALVFVLDRARDLAFALALDRTLNRALLSRITFNCAIFISIFIDGAYTSGKRGRTDYLFKMSHSNNDIILSWESYRNAFMEVHHAMAVVEARRQGRLPAWEGIRVVRERVDLDVEPRPSP
jgi:energy-coupling factor transporter ATP-binding protein EcfA2